MTDVTGRFHDPPTGIGSAGSAGAGARSAGGSSAGAWCGVRKSRIGSESGGTSLVAMSPKMEMPSSTGAALVAGLAPSSAGGGGSSTPECAYLIGPRRRGLGHGVRGAGDAGVLAAVGGRVSVSGRSYRCLHAGVRLRPWLR
jgi:hypothetical protein